MTTLSMSRNNSDIMSLKIRSEVTACEVCHLYRQAKTGQDIPGYRGTAQEHTISINDDLLLEFEMFLF